MAHQSKLLLLALVSAFVLASALPVAKTANAPSKVGNDVVRSLKTSAHWKNDDDDGHYSDSDDDDDSYYSDSDDDDDDDDDGRRRRSHYW